MTNQASIVTVTLNPAVDQSVVLENFTLNTVNRVQSTQADPGGKGVNVSCFLADLGIATSATGFIGQANAHIFEPLFNDGLITDQFIRLEGSTRVNVKVIDTVSKGITELNFPGLAVSQAHQAQLFSVIDDLSHRHDWFVLAGSVPEGLSQDIYFALVQHLKQLGKKVMLDTSRDALRFGLKAKPSVIKPNIHELEDILSTRLTTPSDVVKAARTLVATGIETVIVSMGKDGALFVNQDQACLVDPLKVDVKSTVGAGDAMVAGYMAAQVQQLGFIDAARLASATATSTLMQLGPHLAEPSALELLMQKIHIHTI